MKTNQRDDIQVLRALALLLVVLYHLKLVDGGFIGVDVFFVISGYVITRSEQIRRMRGEEFSIANFTLRRGMRLLPALLLMLILTQWSSLLILSPFGEIQEVVSGSIAAASSLANAFYYLDVGYFEIGSVVRPLLHTWSLSVEVQFYLAFAFGYGLWIFFCSSASTKLTQVSLRNLGLIFLAALLTVSLVGSSLLAAGQTPVPLPFRFAFFGTPVRAWEFLVGVFVALIRRTEPKKDRVSKPLFIMSVFALSASAWILNDYSVFPGLTALVPVLATASIIHINEHSNPKKSVSPWKLRRLRTLLLWIGDHSYGLYLWHYPLITFSNVISQSLQIPELTGGLAAVATSTLLAAISYRYVERPLQRESNRRRQVQVLALTMGLVLISGVVVNEIARSGLGLVSKDDVFDPISQRPANCTESETSAGIAGICSASADALSLAFLVGDSQAGSLLPGLASSLSKNGVPLQYRSLGGCPFLSIPPMGQAACRRHNHEVVSTIKSLRPSIVVIANAGIRYLGPDTRIPVEAGGLPRSINERIDSYVDSAVAMVDALREPGRLIIYVFEPPSVVINQRVSLIQQNPRWIDGNLEEQVERLKIITSLSSQMSGWSDVVMIDPAEALCQNLRCPVFSNQSSLYADSTHLSFVGSILTDSLFDRALRFESRDR